MDETNGRKPRLSKRRLTLWALFGTVGLIMGAAYATGFASTNNTATDANAGEATQLLGKPAAANPSQYAGTVARQQDLGLTFDGNYGTVAAPRVLFTVDLGVNDPYGQALTGTYYADVVLSNWATLGLDVGGTGPPQWDTIELKWWAVDCTGAALAGFTNFQTPGTDPPGNASAQMHVDRVDAHVTFTGLTAGEKYCIGLDTASATTEAAVLQAATAGNVDGTVLFRPNANPTAVLPTVPQFALTVARSA
jgi:hypothetical protein